MSDTKRKKSDPSTQCPVISDPMEALRRFSQDVEAVIAPASDSNGANKNVKVLGFRPTFKAYLAQKGILIQHTIGSGTYSKVKLALKYKFDENGGQLCEPSRVAVKIIDKMKAPSDYQQRFLPRELTIWPNLRHPYIVPLLDVHRDSRYLYMVVPYAPGGDALTYIQQYGALKEEATLLWMRQVTSAVLYLHEHWITHRDLKLENLLIDANGEIVLCDFGFVKGNCGPETDLSATFCGSKSYASPEILNAQLYDPRKADVWAIGVITYILVTGRMPFDESRGTRSVLSEQKNLRFRWNSSDPPSETCKAFILETFTWDFTKRPTIEQVVDHAWFEAKEEEQGKRPKSAMETASHIYHGQGDE